MSKSKSDISNSALRIFLQRVGKFYDEPRGFDEFKPSLKQKKEILDFFGEHCCSCDDQVFYHQRLVRAADARRPAVAVSLFSND